MQRRSFLAMLLLAPMAGRAAGRGSSWIWYGGEGRLAAVRVDDGATMQSLTVQDPAEFVVNTAGSRVYTLDDGVLRVIHAETGLDVLKVRLPKPFQPELVRLVDDRWIFLRRDDDGWTFDISSQRFYPWRRSDRIVGWPDILSLRNGTMLGVAPGLLYRYQGPPDIPDWLPEPAQPLPFANIASAAVRPYHRRVVMLESPTRDRSWRIAEVRLNPKKIVVHDLRPRLRYHGYSPELRAGARLNVSPDDRRLLISSGPHVWLFDADTWELQHHVVLPHDGVEAEFTPDSRYAVVAVPQDGTLYRITTRGRLEVVALGLPHRLDRMSAAPPPPYETPQ